MFVRWLPALPVALALLFVACGGGDDAATDAGGGRAPTATPAADRQSPADIGRDGGDSDGANGSVEAVDACSLITQDEALAALGIPVNDGQPDDFSPVFSCRYETEGVEYVDVSVLVYPDAAIARDGYRMALDINDYPEIEGLGDGAYFALGFGVTALQGKYEVTVNVAGPDDDQPLEEGLVRNALERLP